MKTLRYLLTALVLMLQSCSSIGQPTATPTHPPPTATFISTFTFTPTVTFTPLPPTNTQTFTPTPTRKPTFTPTLRLTNTPIPSATSEQSEGGFLTPTPMATRVYSDTAIVVKDFEDYALSLAWSKDTRYLYIGTENKGLITYDLTRRKIISYFGYDLKIQALAISPNGKTLAAGLADDGSIRLVSATTGDLIRTIWPAHDDFVQVLTFSPNGKYLASGGDDGKVILWEVATGNLVKKLLDEDGWVWALAFSPDGKLLIGGLDNNRQYYVWNTTTWEIQSTFQGDLAADLAFSPDGTKIVTAGGGWHEANLWDVATGNLIFNLREMPGWVWAVSYDPKGRFVAAGGVGAVVVLWDTTTGKPARELYTGVDFIQTILYSPDGTKLATGGSKVIIWDMTKP